MEDRVETCREMLLEEEACKLMMQFSVTSSVRTSCIGEALAV